MVFALAAVVAAATGGHAHVNVGGLLFLFVIGGLTGLTLAMIYNKGRKDAAQVVSPSASEKSATDITNKTAVRLIAVVILTLPFLLFLSFFIFLK